MTEADETEPAPRSASRESARARLRGQAFALALCALIGGCSNRGSSFTLANGCPEAVDWRLVSVLEQYPYSSISWRELAATASTRVGVIDALDTYVIELHNTAGGRPVRHATVNGKPLTIAGDLCP